MLGSTNELPQLFNVVKGEMCIVGPRLRSGPSSCICSKKIPYYRQRLCVKPGVTDELGAGQSTNTATPSKTPSSKLEYDLYYIKATWRRRSASTLIFHYQDGFAGPRERNSGPAKHKCR